MNLSLLYRLSLGLLLIPLSSCALLNPSVQAPKVTSTLESNTLGTLNGKPIYTSEIPNEVIDVVSISEEILKDRPKLPSQILKSWQMAVDYAEQNPDEAHAIMAEREGLTVEEFRSSLALLQVLNASDQKKFFSNPLNLQASIKKVCETLNKVTATKLDCSSLSQLLYQEP